MNLARLVLETRTLLGELNPDSSRFTDVQIKSWLTEAAMIACSECQLLRDVYKVLVTDGKQEYPLPPDAEDVEFAKYYQGANLTTLTPMDQVDAQFGSQVKSHSTHYYTRRGLTHVQQGTDGNLERTEVPQRSEQGRQSRLIVGLYPIPNNSTDYLIVQYFQTHYEMQHDNDIPAMPAPYHEGLIQFATKKAKEQIHDLVEAKEHDAKWEAYLNRVREKVSNGGQLQRPPQWKIPNYKGSSIKGKSTFIHVGNADYE